MPARRVLKGRVYVLTGTFDGIERAEVRKELEARGAKVATSISVKTTAVIAGKAPGNAKIDKANDLDIPILNEADLGGLLRD